MGPTFQFLGVETELFAPSLIPLLGVLAAALLYLRACSILAERGRHIGMGQRVSYFLGLGLVLIATQTFVDSVGEHALVSLHMAQHMLIADLPAPLLLYGARAPLLYFFWPRSVLVTFARLTLLRRFWAWLRRPLVALTVWLVTLFAWHAPPLYEAALTNRLVHDLEHITFAFTGILAWWPLLDPTHHRTEGRFWKAAYVFAARMVGGILGILLIIWPRQIYGTYGDRAREYGMSIITDQQIAGGIMMGVDTVIVLFGVTYFLVTMDRGEESRDDIPDAARAAAMERSEADARSTLASAAARDKR
ncbi:MAG: Cytochrome c oxidase caa3-type, assembly factor CtaG-related protein [Thermoleophilia bacterium]|nr:Cytochrome c oxidase caa3-type, assembly factor CtaG-related protein [Thermoleophilia bacterium]